MTDLLLHVRQTGRRMTTQRTAVYEAPCASKDHPTAEELYLELRGRLPHISLATVYNNLEMLVEAGMAIKLTGERSARYDAVCMPHAHARCLRCGTVQDLPLNTAAALQALALPSGFIPSSVTVDVEGECAECARRTNAG